MNLPTLRNLHYLVQLYKYQHFGKAAQACFVSQSTLSTGIRLLEEQFGIQLVERDNKSLLFTEVGITTVTQASQILMQVENLVNVVGAQQKPFAGKLRVGCIPTIAPFLLPTILKYLRSKYSNLTLIIKEDTTEQLLSVLHSGQLDLVLMALPYETSGLDSYILGRDYFQFAYHKQRDFKKNRSVDYDELPPESILLLEDGHCLRNHALAACHLTKHAAINTYSVSSLHTLVHMVNNDLGVTFLPDMAIKTGILKGTAVEIRKLTMGDAYREIGLVWRDTSGYKTEYLQLCKSISKVIRV